MARLLYRQVHPSFLEADNVVGTRTFDPLRSGAGSRSLSVYDGNEMSPAAAFEHYTEELGLPSCGIIAVDAEECAQLGVEVVYDGLGFPAHASLQFQGLSRRLCRASARRLRDFALARGWLHGPMGDGA